MPSMPELFVEVYLVTPVMPVNDKISHQMEMMDTEGIYLPGWPESMSIVKNGGCGCMTGGWEKDQVVAIGRNGRGGRFSGTVYPAQ